MSFGFRAYASILVPLSLAVALPAGAGDVDTHFDRARGKADVVRSPAGSTATSVVRLDTAKGAAEIAVAKGQTVTVVVTPHGEQACLFDVRVK